MIERPSDPYAEYKELRRVAHERARLDRLRAERDEEKAREAAARPVEARELDAVRAAGEDRLARMRAHADFWVRELQIKVIVRPDWQERGKIAGTVMEVGPLSDAAGYAVWMHEMGHAATTHHNLGARETRAWHWARARARAVAIAWTPNMDGLLARCLKTYAPHAQYGDGLEQLVRDGEQWGEARRAIAAVRLSLPVDVRWTHTLRRYQKMRRARPTYSLRDEANAR
jgi:hypothetical protein